MIWQFGAVLSLAVCVLGHAISEQSIRMRHDQPDHGHHGDLSHIGSHQPEHHEEYAWSYPSYEFSYKVEDPHTHDMKGHRESRHGDEVKGEYWLIEPDGRKRTVKYEANKHSGFNAHVEYSGPHHHDHSHGRKHDDHIPRIEHHHEEHHDSHRPEPHHPEPKHPEPEHKDDHHHHEEAREHPSRVPLHSMHHYEMNHHPRFHGSRRH